MAKLYIDCDGVILNTMEVAAENFRKLGGNPENYEEFHNYFLTIDWVKLIKDSKPIKDSIEKIRNIAKSKDFDDVVILTKTSGNPTEEYAKIEYFKAVLPEIRVIIVPWDKQKADVVDSKGNYLVDDDFSRNCLYWLNKGGIPIFFTTTSIFSETIISSNGEDKTVYCINDLNDVYDVKQRVKQISID